MKFKWQWIKFTAYAMALILLNSAASTLFFRIDLTRNKIHSLSQASIEAVSKLEEPLTVKAFFSENLPTPYNNLEQEIGDLLETYGLKGNKFFNYSIHTIGTDGADETETSKASRADAQSYGIFPIQIQKVEADEVNLVSAFMGMVFIHGDLIETIPVLGAGENREITITSTIQKMSDKTGAILGMENDILVKLYQSSSLKEINASLADYPAALAKEVEELNRRYYGRLDFRLVDPENLAAGEKSPEEYGLTGLSLQSGVKVYANVVVDNGKTARRINLFRRNLFGGYEIEDPAALANNLPGVVDTLVGINPKMGFLTDHDSRGLYGGAQDQNAPGLNNFRTLLGRSYDLVDVSLADGIPEDVSTLLVVSPKGGFTEWELFQIDQYLMKGNSLAFFIDSMDEIRTQGGNPYGGQAPVYLPRSTGLEPLLTHYGFAVENSYILDENCYVQTDRDQSGGLREIKFYFAPYIESETIDTGSVVMGNIKRLLILNNSPVTLNAEPPSGIAPQVLFSSSPQSWEMKEQINLYNPMTIYPPPDDDRSSTDAAALASGSMTSYFKGKSIPEPPQPTESPEDGGEDTPTFSADQAVAETVMIESGEGRIFVIGSSTLLMDNILDAEGSSANATFLLNLADTLSGREDYARMRSKGQTFSPLGETSGAMKRLVKSFNIVGLPLIIIFLGIVVWLRGLSRKKRIELLFTREAE